MSEHDGADDDSGEQGAESKDDGPGEQRGKRKHEGPGGGPKRVVSNTSVDDILNSLNETNDGDSSPQSTGDTRAQSEPSADSRGELEDETSLEEDEEAKEAGAENADGNGGESEQAQTAEMSDGETEPERARHDQPTASTTTPDNLSSRVERGTVTGADVRAAEAGEGRDRTPDIDEINLSLDDLETNIPSESEASGSTAASTSNRANGPASSSDEADDQADSNGLLARLRNLFSQ